jgi:phage terminase large subunit GpA-like protein
MNEKQKKFIAQCVSVVEPPPRYTVSDFADNHRILGSETSAYSGKWRTSLTPYLKEVMDCFTRPEVEQVVFIASSQIGKSECVNNILLYFTLNDPSPVLLVQPTLSEAQSYSKIRIAPMYKICNVITEEKKKTSDDTVLFKKFEGGYVSFAGANSPNGLASKPVRVILFDEAEKYPISAGDAGSPINLGRQRSQTFFNRKILIVSTPLVKGESVMETEFESCQSKNYFLVPCPHCGTKQRLTWSGVKWDKDENENHIPSSAYYECVECQKPINDVERQESLQSGEWMTATEFNDNDIFQPIEFKPYEPTLKTAFHISALYSPFVQLEQVVSQFLEAKKSPMKLRQWTNEILGESFSMDMNSEEISPDSLVSRAYEWDNIPNDISVITAGVDTQDSWLSYQILGHSESGDSWVLEHGEVRGDPVHQVVWDELTAVLDKTYTREDGVELKIAGTCIDSGGHRTTNVYTYCKTNLHKKVYAIKGVNNSEHEPIIAGKPSFSNSHRIPLYKIGTFSAKEHLFARLKIEDFNAGYIHFNKKYCDEDYFNELTAEKLVTTYSKGFPKRTWKKIRARNEQLDTFIYATAALHILKPNFKLLNKNLEHNKQSVKDIIDKNKRKEKTEINKENESTIDPEKPIQQHIQKTQPRRRPRRSGFVNGWK